MNEDVVFGRVINLLAFYLHDFYKKIPVKLIVRVTFDDGSRVVFKGDGDNEENEVVKKEK